MKIVLDTNVLVSGLLTPFGTCGAIVRMLTSDEFTLCVDSRILVEYDEVLHRPRFNIDPQKAAAEMAIRFNKDLEKVSENDSTGEFTFRNKKTGEATTMSYSDIAEGKITVKDAEGNVTQIGGKADLSNVPKWVPRYPGGEAAAGVFQQKKGSKVEGVATITTSDAPEKVVAFFKEAGEKDGMTAGSENTMNLGGQQISQLELTSDGKKLTVSASKNSGDEKTTVTLMYNEGGE